MKVAPKYYKEIAYVVISDLPEVQQKQVLATKEMDYIKILIDGKITGPCLQYKHYEAWYSTVYHPKPTKSTTTKTMVVKGLALGKA